MFESSVGKDSTLLHGLRKSYKAIDMPSIFTEKSSVIFSLASSYFQTKLIKSIVHHQCSCDGSILTNGIDISRDERLAFFSSGVWDSETAIPLTSGNSLSKWEPTSAARL